MILLQIKPLNQCCPIQVDGKPQPFCRSDVETALDEGYSVSVQSSS